MMLDIIKFILSSVRESVGKALHKARLQKKYPTCRFYPGMVVDESSTLGKHNVIFKNVSIVNSSIGDHTFVQRNSQIHHANVGKYCSIAPGVVIGLGRHPIGFVSTHPAFYSVSQPIERTYADNDYFEPFKRTTIGNDVWLGQNALVVDGTTIGDGAVIGAGSVVTKDVPAYAIAAGIPARIIRYRFDEGKRTDLLKSEWWNMPEDLLKENFKAFQNIRDFFSLKNK